MPPSYINVVKLLHHRVQFEDSTPSRSFRLHACWSTVAEAACYAACGVANTAVERAEKCASDCTARTLQQQSAGYSLRKKTKKRRRLSDFVVLSSDMRHAAESAAGASAEQTRVETVNGAHVVYEDENGFTSPSVPWQTEDVSLEDAFLAAQSECWEASSMDVHSAQLMHWHLANLEYACAAELREVSNAHWDQVRATCHSCCMQLRARPVSVSRPSQSPSRTCVHSHRVPPPLSLSLSLSVSLNTGCSRTTRATSTIWEAITL